MPRRSHHVGQHGEQRRLSDVVGGEDADDLGLVTLSALLVAQDAESEDGRRDGPEALLDVGHHAAARGRVVGVEVDDLDPPGSGRARTCATAPAASGTRTDREDDDAGLGTQTAGELDPDLATATEDRDDAHGALRAGPGGPAGGRGTTRGRGSPWTRTAAATPASR